MADGVPRGRTVSYQRTQVPPSAFGASTTLPGPSAPSELLRGAVPRFPHLRQDGLDVGTPRPGPAEPVHALTKDCCCSDEHGETEARARRRPWDTEVSPPPPPPPPPNSRGAWRFQSPSAWRKGPSCFAWTWADNQGGKVFFFLFHAARFSATALYQASLGYIMCITTLLAIAAVVSLPGAEGARLRQRPFYLGTPQRTRGCVGREDPHPHTLATQIRPIRF